jgi:hypothetical protein
VLGSGDSNLAKLSGIATAYRFIGDRRSVAPLVEMMFDADMTTISRAFVAAALGGIADKSIEPWNSRLAEGTNYRAAVDTLTNGTTGVLDIL